MAKESLKPTVKLEPSSTADTENDQDEIFEESENLPIDSNLDPALINRDARRKIEIYWEKKRLRDQFEDFDESEFGF